MNRALIFVGGIAATFAFAALWHGPLGAGERLAARAETTARRTLVHYELPAISAHLARDPMSRTMVLSGPADRFQRGELVRIMLEVPGINAARWDPVSLPQEAR